LVNPLSDPCTDTFFLVVDEVGHRGIMP
jgi:hypothetical protein